MFESALRRLALAVLVLLAVPALAQIAEVPKIRCKQFLRIRLNGEAEVTNDITLPMMAYNNFKQQISSTKVLLRQLVMAGEATEVKDPRVVYDDAHHAIQVKAILQGEIKNRGKEWFVRYEDSESIEVVDTDAEAITLLQISPLDSGVVVIGSARIEFPPGTKNIRFDASRGGVLFEMPPPPPPTQQRGDVEMRLEAKHELMSCFYKVYGNPKFTKLWAARAVVRNNSRQILHDFKVRFRIPEYADWSAWQRSGLVYPSQTVTEPYYPILRHNVKDLKSATPTVVEMAWQFTTPDGKVVEDSEQCPTTILGLNEVVCSSLPSEECTTWFESFDNSPLIGATFVSHTDPVVQRFAGMAAGLAGGAGASLSNTNALRFMKAVYDLMCYNKIKYQSPPWLFKKGLQQHVKFGRDVLQNRAGTCIDLAVLYASTCQAGGLEPCVVFLPGHVFPVIKLPEGGMQAVETTMVSGDPRGQKIPFERAGLVGMKELAECQEKGLFFLVDVQKLRAAGVPTPELPDLPPSALNDWDIKAPEGQAQETGGGDASGGGGETPADMKQLNDPNGAYAIAIPANWRSQEQQGNLLAADPQGQATMVCKAAPRQAADLQQFVQTSVANWKQQIPGWTQDSQANVRVSGRLGVFVRATGKPGGSELRADYFLVLTDRHQLLLVLASAKDAADQHQDAFKRILQSWRIR